MSCVILGSGASCAFASNTRWRQSWELWIDCLLDTFVLISSDQSIEVENNLSLPKGRLGGEVTSGGEIQQERHSQTVSKLCELLRTRIGSISGLRKRAKHPKLNDYCGPGAWAKSVIIPTFFASIAMLWFAEVLMLFTRGFAIATGNRHENCVPSSCDSITQSGALQ